MLKEYCSKREFQKDKDNSDLKIKHAISYAFFERIFSSYFPSILHKDLLEEPSKDQTEEKFNKFKDFQEESHKKTIKELLKNYKIGESFYDQVKKNPKILNVYHLINYNRYLQI